MEYRRYVLVSPVSPFSVTCSPPVSVPPGLQGKPSCWVVLTQDRQTKVLVASGPELYVLDNTSCTAVVSQKIVRCILRLVKTPV